MRFRRRRARGGGRRKKALPSLTSSAPELPVACSGVATTGASFVLLSQRASTYATHTIVRVGLFVPVSPEKNRSDDQQETQKGRKNNHASHAGDTYLGAVILGRLHRQVNAHGLLREVHAAEEGRATAGRSVAF